MSQCYFLLFHNATRKARSYSGSLVLCIYIRQLLAHCDSDHVPNEFVIRRRWHLVWYMANCDTSALVHTQIKWFDNRHVKKKQVDAPNKWIDEVSTRSNMCIEFLNGLAASWSVFSAALISITYAKHAPLPSMLYSQAFEHAARIRALQSHGYWKIR